MLLACGFCDSCAEDAGEDPVPLSADQPSSLGWGEEDDLRNLPQEPCRYSRYHQRPGSLLLVVDVDTDGIYSLEPVSGPSESLVVYSTGDLGYHPSTVPVFPGEEVRVYICQNHAWAYLGNLDISTLTSHGGQVDHLSVPKPSGQPDQVPWEAIGYLVHPAKHL